MLRKTFPVVLCLVLFVSSIPAFAAGDHRPYVGIQLGAVFATDNDAGLVSNMDYDPGFTGSIAAGYDHGWRYGHARSELELSYRQSDIDSGSLGSFSVTDGAVSALSLMLNLFYTIETGYTATPYLVGGLGASTIDFDNVKIDGTTFIDDSEIALAYQVGFGIDLPVLDNWTVDLGYRYFGTADKEFENEALTSKEFDYRFKSHNASLGLRYKF